MGYDIEFRLEVWCTEFSLKSLKKQQHATIFNTGVAFFVKFGSKG
jgi:hypothetical protein